MMARLSEGRPSVGTYLTSPVCNLAAELRIAVIGALFLGSPIPRWMTGSPLSLSRWASSLSLSVAESLMVLANWLMDIDGLASYTLSMRSERARRWLYARQTMQVESQRQPPHSPHDFR